MNDVINLGIGFVAGRPNVCNVINSYYNHILNDVKRVNKNVKITIFILYDLDYTNAKEDEFYKINEEVYKNIKIKFITPKDIELEKKKIANDTDISIQEISLFLGNGHAKSRNTLMYFAYMNNIDYLLFWDDDEYPVACIKSDEKIIWKKQNNISMHLKYIEDADVTIGYHCGYVSPIPYIEFKNDKEENLFRCYIEAVSNDIISWESIKRKMQIDNGVTFANSDIASENGCYEIQKQKAGKWVAGSTLCINLKNIDKIPAFYNPLNARGEDTFFSTRLENAKVLKVPVYHFHDGFLMCSNIMDEKYPTYLEKADNNENIIEKRFFKATIGWIRYKPLLMYINDKEHYNEEIKIVKEKLKYSITKMEKIFRDYDFNIIINELETHDKKVENDYLEYLKTNEIWNKLKQKRK